MSRNDNFLKGAAILGVAGIIVKILGAIYRLPLSNIIKSEGMGYYQTAYPLYTLLLTISTAGFPIAIAKLVTERRAIGDYKNAHKVFKTALIALLIGGFLTSSFVLFKGQAIVEKLDNKNAYYALVALVPALLIVPVMAAFRGFYQGRQEMTPTALSQVAEQLLRMLGGLFFTYILLDRGIPIAAGGASFGGSLGALAGFLVILLIYFISLPEIKREISITSIEEEYKTKQIIKDLLMISLPITLGAAVIPVMDSIDVFIVLKRLQAIGFTEKTANDLYGNLKGMASTLINLPQVLSVAISMSLVPAIANANARNDREEIDHLVSSGTKLTLFIGLPSAFGLFVLARPIIELLYYKNDLATIENTASLLAVLAFGVVFLTMVQVLASILNGLGKPIVPAINLLIGAIFKVILSYSLTGLVSINIHGAAISTVVAYGIAAILDLYFVLKYAKVTLNIKDVFIKPLISSIGMAVSAFLSYRFLYNIIGGKLATVVSILLAGIVYFILLIITGSISEEDLSLVPKGDSINKKIDKFRLIR